MKRIAALLLVGAAAVPTGLLAHGGHEHKAMGTLMAVEKGRMDVRTREGKDVSVLLTAETKYFRGKSPAGVQDLKVGDRVVVSYVEEGQRKTAREVRLSTAPQGKAAPRKTSPDAR